MEKEIRNTRFGEERALYGSRGLLLSGCAFAGEEDGESALKESEKITVENTLCDLRYPFWHDRALTLRTCTLTENCRAALWYSEDIDISDSALHGIKALRECRNARLSHCDILSPEFGWSTEGITLRDCRAEGEYFCLRGRELVADRLRFTGKYSFQYVENARVTHSELNTKDAFWHAKNVTVEDSVLRGEYLGWYSENLTLIRCKIIGTQPLCYCKALTLIDCETEGCDLAFEKSEVHARLLGEIDSVKNPKSGEIRASRVGAIILDDEAAKGKIICS